MENAIEAIVVTLYQTILLAVNPDTPIATTLMDKATALAQLHGAQLHLAFVEPGLGNVSYIDIELELESLHNEMQMKRMEQLGTLAQSSAVAISAIHITEGSVPEHLIALSEQVDADLVILGRHRGGLHWFGNIAQAIEMQASADLLICH